MKSHESHFETLYASDMLVSGEQAPYVGMRDLSFNYGSKKKSQIVALWNGEGVIHETYVWSAEQSWIKQIPDTSLGWKFTVKAGMFNNAWERGIDIRAYIKLCRWEIANTQSLHV